MLRVLADTGWHCVWERDSSVSHVDVDLDEIGGPNKRYSSGESAS